VASIITEKHYRKGEIIIQELTEAERFFIIYQGKIEITKRFDSNEESVLAVQSDGDFFGEMALLDERPRSATARALEPTTVLEITRSDFDTLLYKAPALAFRILKELSSRLRETGALLISLLRQRNRQLLRSHIDTIAMVVHAIEKRDEQTIGHTRRVTDVARALGKEMGLGDEELMGLELSALLHDFGMLSVPESVLHKSAALEEQERNVIRAHPEKARVMLEGIPLLAKAIPDVVHHHEKFNGSGYPDGLTGENIPQASRVLAVVDALEAMTRERPYRKKLSPAAALKEIQKASGTQFDPGVVAALLKLQESGTLAGML
jgi:HD-GYP domain-containing protein (c-di-GMP phosphodiesterase class II)